MELKRIRQLLEKFYDGNTSFDEENTLIRYFYYHPNEVAEDLKPDRDFFLSCLSIRRDVPEHPGLKDKLVTMIDKKEHEKNRSLRSQMYYIIGSIAASVAVFIYLMVHEPGTKPDVKDSFNDPKIAYEEARKTLLYISKKLNTGTESLQHVAYLDEGFSELSALSAFSSGFKDLELFSKYYNENNVENKK